VPWATPTAFASLATGTNPGKHGVYDFGVLKGLDYTSFTPTNGASITGPSLWKLLSNAGLRSLVINVPMTFPAEQINGAIISGIPYPSGSGRVCYPPDLLGDLQRKGWDLGRNASDDLAGSYSEYYDGLLKLVKDRGEAAAWLMRKYRPDFTAVHFLETDQVQHRYWQFLPGEPRYEVGGTLTDAILRLYHEVEEALALILAEAGNDVTLCLMSDHGFGPTRQQVWLNNWLIKNGYLVLRATASVKMKQAIYRLGLSPAAIRERAPERLKLAILQFFERQKGRAIAAEMESQSEPLAKKSLADRLTERLALDFYDVSWSESRAFSTGTTAVGYVYLNVAGRDPQGIVQPGAAYERLRDEIIAALKTWAPVGEVIRRENEWHGPQLHNAPDIVVRWASPETDARYFQTRISSHHLQKSVPNDYASHRREGLFLFRGQHVSSGNRVDADILDLTPTFLWLLDQPVPTYMDGRVLDNVIQLDRPVIRQEMPIIETSQSEDTLTADEEAAIEESLRSLGYLE
jgi:predicted AlkP superfamily phosphohydrolase/phosphomutase